MTALPAEAGSENDSGLIAPCTLHLSHQQVGAYDGIKEMCKSVRILQ